MHQIAQNTVTLLLLHVTVTT